MMECVTVCRSGVKEPREREHETHSSDTEDLTAEWRWHQAASQSFVETLQIWLCAFTS